MFSRMPKFIMLKLAEWSGKIYDRNAIYSSTWNTRRKKKPDCINTKLWYSNNFIWIIEERYRRI